MAQKIVGENALRAIAGDIKGEINAIKGVWLFGTLTAGSTSLVFTDDIILDSKTYDIYVDTWGAEPTNAVVDEGTHTLTLTFTAQVSDVVVEVKVT